MQVFRQNHHGGDGEGMPLLHQVYHLAEDINVIYQQGPAPLRQDSR
jgi:hypothetical protein